MPSSPSLSSAEKGATARHAAPRAATAVAYSTRILKGAALVPYAKELLRDWDEARSNDENMDGYRRSGAFGRASQGRAVAILRVLGERYLADEDVRRGLSILCRARPEPPTIEHVLAYHAALTDPLLYDFGAEFLFSRHRLGLNTISLHDAVEFLSERGVLAEPRPWSMATTEEVSRKLLTAFRDFGFLRGAARKTLTTSLPPPLAVVWVATHRIRVGAPPRLVDDRSFRLLLLSPDEAESRLRVADDLGLIRVEGAGAVARIDLRHRSLEELARAV